MTLRVFSALRTPGVSLPRSARVCASLAPPTRFSPSTRLGRDTPLSLCGLQMESRGPESSEGGRANHSTPLYAVFPNSDHPLPRSLLSPVHPSPSPQPTFLFSTALTPDIVHVYCCFCPPLTGWKHPEPWGGGRGDFCLFYFLQTPQCLGQTLPRSRLASVSFGSVCSR